MLARVLSVGLLAGLLAGLLIAVLQQVTTTPLILLAETYETQGAAVTAVPPAPGAAKEHDHAAHDHGWKPADGLPRFFYTAVATVATAVGISFLLLAGMIFAGDAIDERRCAGLGDRGLRRDRSRAGGRPRARAAGQRRRRTGCAPGLVDRHGAGHGGRLVGVPAQAKSPRAAGCRRRAAGAACDRRAASALVRKQGAGGDRRAVCRPVAGRAGPVVGARRDRGRPALADLCSRSRRAGPRRHDGARSSSASRAAARSATVKSRSISPAMAWRKRSEPACKATSRLA